MALTGRTVTIYRFKKYDIATDEPVLSRRWATTEAIARVNGTAMKDTATVVDVSVVGSEVEGMTVRGFDPHAQHGFQTVVTSGLREP